MRATASAWITSHSFSTSDVTGAAGSTGLTDAAASWTVTDVDASHDDDSGRVRLAFELNASAMPGYAQVSAVSFQVTVLAAI